MVKEYYIYFEDKKIMWVGIDLLNDFHVIKIKNPYDSKTYLNQLDAINKQYGDFYSKLFDKDYKIKSPRFFKKKAKANGIIEISSFNEPKTRKSTNIENSFSETQQINNVYSLGLKEQPEPKEYYKIKLNHGRWHDGYFPAYGYLKFLPTTTYKLERGIISNREVPVVEYNGIYYLIAEQKNGCYEDIVSGKKLVYDKSGLSDYLSFGMYGMPQLISKVEVYDTLKKFEDKKVIKKYYEELDEVKNRYYEKIKKYNEEVQRNNKEQQRVKYINEHCDEYVELFKKNRRK